MYMRIYIHTHMNSYDIVKFCSNVTTCVMHGAIQEFCNRWDQQKGEEEDDKKLGPADLSRHLCPVARRRLGAGLCMRRLARPGLRSAAPGLPAAAALPSGTAGLP